jgi:hypothetical protein
VDKIDALTSCLVNLDILLPYFPIVIELKKLGTMYAEMSSPRFGEKNGRLYLLQSTFKKFVLDAK